MKTLLASLFAATFLFPIGAGAAGLPPWEFGMSKAKVVGFAEFGPYKYFSNGDPETYNWPFHGRNANVQFFFEADRLNQIGVYLFEGQDPKQGIPVWVRAYEALQKDYGKLVTPDIHVSAKGDPVDAEALAIGAAALADTSGESRMVPETQPAGMQITAKFFSRLVGGKKWFYIAVFFEPKN